MTSTATQDLPRIKTWLALNRFNAEKREEVEMIEFLVEQLDVPEWKAKDVKDAERALRRIRDAIRDIDSAESELSTAADILEKIVEG